MLRVGEGGQLMEFDAEFKFAKIQNPHVGGGGGRGSRNLMLSSNLLKTKIHMLRGGRGILCWVQICFKKNFFAKNFLNFQTKIGTVWFWSLSTEWFPYTKYRRTTKIIPHRYLSMDKKHAIIFIVCGCYHNGSSLWGWEMRAAECELVIGVNKCRSSFQNVNPMLDVLNAWFRTMSVNQRKQKQFLFK